MEAANRGASDAGAPSIGFNIQLLHEQQPNAYNPPDLTFSISLIRNAQVAVGKARAGTSRLSRWLRNTRRVFEIMNLVRRQRTPAISILCFNQDYWTRLINFKSLDDHGMIDTADLETLCFANDIEERWNALVVRGLS
jgi:predicted Rossmann-fold nucleotide-binding protein